MGGTNSTKVKRKLEGAPVVVVVGGGYGGVALAKALDKSFNVVLIDRKDYFLHNIGALRACVEPSYARSICVPYANLLKFGHVIQAEVTRVSQGGVYVFGRDEPIDFDYLVIATGTSYAFPAKIATPSYEDAPALYQRLNETIGGAQRIVVVGGGPTGVELASEIKETSPEKEVTLVHSRDELIGGPFKDRFKEMVLEKVQELGVEVILGDRLVMEDDFQELRAANEFNYLEGERTLTLTSGHEVECDLVFFCIGAKVNKASYENDFASSMELGGRLRVNEYLQVDGYDNIFALGDCTNWDEVKLGYAAQNQATIVARNISSLHNGKSLKAYNSGNHVMIVTVGRNGGVSQLPVRGRVMGSTFSKHIKSKGLFTANQWKILNLKMPKSDSDELVIPDDMDETDDVPRMANAMQISEDEAEALLQGMPAAEHDGVDYT